VAGDDAGERTEQPTQRRLTEAREEGRIPRSSDLTAAVALLGALLLLKFLGSAMFSRMMDHTRALASVNGVTPDTATAWLGIVAVSTGQLLFPFLLLLMVVTIVGSAVQSGVPISFKRLQPKLERLSPINGVKRIFSLDSVNRAGMGVLKMLIVGCVAYVTIVGEIDDVLRSGGLGPRGFLVLIATLLYRLASRMAIVLLILALIDYTYQRWNWLRKLKMTKQEIRDELKNMEGDPQMRQRRRRVQLSLNMQRISQQVPKADVIVTNPTEYSVALAYDDATMGAPRVLAKGKELMALRIRQIAQQHGIPIVQRPPLARALYASVEVGQEVPPAFYRAVAEVLAYVYQLTGKARATG